jgi:hypothetical protein
MSVYSIHPITVGGVRTYALSSRKSKVTVADFARPIPRQASLVKWFDALPDILAAKDLRELSANIRVAHKRRRPVLWGMGGHVVKVGLAPVLIQLMDAGFVSGIAMNGAALIHDYEIALAGKTSEDVDAVIGKGEFGMAAETASGINEIAKLAQRIRIGYGEAAGQYLTSELLAVRHPEKSLLVAAYQRRIPVTVHLAIGTDIPHMHPSADGAALGAASYTDFRLFCSLVGQMDGGGVYLNWGSAVLLPEIFLKAVSVVRNLGVPLNSITTANFDFIQHYRAVTNVVKRPTAASNVKTEKASRGYAITGHHEIMLPLLAGALLAGWPGKGRRPKR